MLLERSIPGKEANQLCHLLHLETKMDASRKMNNVFDRVRHSIERTNDRLKDHYSVLANDGGDKDGDKGWLHIPQSCKGSTPKRSYEDPYQVKKKINCHLLHAENTNKDAKGDPFQ